MVKYESPSQLKIEEFKTPFLKSLLADNRWVLLSKVVPWDKFATLYLKAMETGTGRPPISPRIVLGALIIKHIEGLDDRGTIAIIQENPYMQYFLGLEDANVKLSSVVSDTSGVTATYLINGLIEGRSDLDNLISECYHRKLHSSREQIKEAINGRLTPHHAFILRSMQKHIASVETQISEIDVEIEKYIKDFEKEIELLQTIPGVGKDGAIGIVAEIGIDMDVFPSEHHLASHSSMCPGNNESAGKKKVQEHDRETSI